MSDIALTAVEYERVFAVLDRCDSVRTVTEFRDVIVEAIPAAFPIRHTSCFVGDTFESQFTDRNATVTAAGSGSDSWETIKANYQEHWARHDVFNIPQARQQLQSTRVASLSELGGLPKPAAVYVHEYLHPHQMHSITAMHLDLAAGGHALIGLFDPDKDAIRPKDLLALRLLARQLSILTRGLQTLPGLDLFAKLTARQREVATLVADGRSNASIAGQLNLTQDTVKKYVSRILAATGCASRTELAIDVRRQSF